MVRILTQVDRLSRLTETLAVVLIYGYCALMLAEVVARAQARSFSFSWEFSQYAMAAIFALGCGPAIRTGVHVRITLVSDYLPGKVARWLEILASLTALIIALLLVSAMWTKVGRSFERDILATTVTQTPLWIPQCLVLWGLLQFTLDLGARVIRCWQNQPCEWRNEDKEASDV